MNTIKRIAINTGGGDAPGLNAVIHAAYMSAASKGWEVWGIHDGLNGILEPQAYPDGGLVRLTREHIGDISHLGGTILGTANHGNPLLVKRAAKGRRIAEVDRGPEVIAAFKKRKIDALISIGGDGSLTIARQLHERGLRVIGVPKTIDNDLECTTTTFGYDSAVSFATECIDRLHYTAHSHHRIMVVEVMGRYAGWIALHAGIAGRADAILIPEIPYDIRLVAGDLKRRAASSGKRYSIVVVAEGALPLGGSRAVKEKASASHVERLGGVGELVSAQLHALTGRESRVVVLGHLLRGGSPTPLDRSLALMFGAAAVRGLHEGQNGVMVALNPPDINYVALSEATARLKFVKRSDYAVLTARTLGISFGDPS